MRKDLQLPATSVEEMDEDLEFIDEGAQQVRCLTGDYTASAKLHPPHTLVLHSTLLGMSP